MKHITKGTEPPEFTDWKSEDKMAPRRPNWKRVSSELKTVILKSLIREQGFICCYCESRVTMDDSHIEHLRPRSRYRDLQFDYNNLLCSCLREQSPGEPDHCGPKKANWFDEHMLISPLQQGCETRFRFTANGEVHPRSRSDVAAATTISRLALDLPKLNALRGAAIDALHDLPVSDIKRVLVQGPDSTFPEYYTTIKDVLVVGGTWSVEVGPKFQSGDLVKSLFG